MDCVLEPWAEEALMRSLLPYIREFYSNEEHMAEYLVWKEKQDRKSKSPPDGSEEQTVSYISVGSAAECESLPETHKRSA